jgi:SAM-dependent methyltransferase
MELGSAPGRNLLLWRRQFGYEVFGVDFSAGGIAVQRRVLSRLGIDESHSILGDFMAPSFRRAYADAFDVVFSGGVIEHFSDPREVVRAHLDVLKPGGTLVVIIPNIAGIYRHLLTPEVIAVHNVAIMKLSSFRELFALPGLDRRYCAYYGGLDLGLAFGNSTAIHRALPKLQILVNLISRVVRIPENRWTSPFLLCVGQKGA